MGQRLTDKTGLTKIEANDLLMVVDVSDTSSSAEETSKKINASSLIQTIMVEVSNSDFTSMDDSGGAGTYVMLIDALGTGFAPIILGANIVVSHSAPNDSASEDLRIGYVVDSSQYAISQRRFMNGVGVDTVFSLAPVSSSVGSTSSLDNTKVVLYSTGNFNGGFSAKVYLTYQALEL